MRAISLWEPWATAMRLGVKTIETRGWHTGYRGPLVICAAKRCVKRDIQEVFEDWKFELPDSPLAALTMNDLHFGMAVCRVDIVACRSTKDQRQTISRENYYTGNYDSGRFGWVTENLLALTPFPVKGKQGFFDVEMPPARDCPKCGEPVQSMGELFDHAKCFGIGKESTAQETEQ